MEKLHKKYNFKLSKIPYHTEKFATVFLGKQLMAVDRTRDAHRKKTKVYTIHNAKNINDRIGEISWHIKSKQYCFITLNHHGSTVLSLDSLGELSDFIVYLENERKLQNAKVHQ